MKNGLLMHFLNCSKNLNNYNYQEEENINIIIMLTNHLFLPYTTPIIMHMLIKLILMRLQIEQKFVCDCILFKSIFIFQCINFLIFFLLYTFVLFQLELLCCKYLTISYVLMGQKPHILILQMNKQAMIMNLQFKLKKGMLSVSLFIS